jgi:hypothetical protein
MKLSMIIQGIISFGVIQELLAAQPIFDLREVTPEISFIFTCDDVSKGCAIRGDANVQVESPVAFCDEGFITWAPVMRIFEPLVVPSCIGGLCTAQCSEGCNCRRSDGGFCPSILEQSDVRLQKRPPVLTNTCKAAHPGLDESLKNDYSSYCPNLMSQELDDVCPCVFNFCNGVFQGCDELPTTNSCVAQNGQRGRERCVAADRLCLNSVDSTDAPGGDVIDLPFFLLLGVSLAVVGLIVMMVKSDHSAMSSMSTLSDKSGDRYTSDASDGRYMTSESTTRHRMNII